MTEISALPYDIDFNGLGLSEKSFRKHEEKLLSRMRANTYSDCKFYVDMSYSSPKGKVKLNKHGEYGFDEMFASFESISRTQLDRETYRKLALVERGMVSDSLRYDIMKRDNFKCAVCGASAKEGARLHVDHVIPISKGGKSLPENLRTLCERCNIGKSDKLEEVPEVESTENNTTDDVCSANICPNCGAKLVLKNGRFGEFLGCSEFPKCKFTKKVE